MLLFSESKTRRSPLEDTSIECGSIPSLLPSKTVSTVYPPSNFTIERPETAEKLKTHQTSLTSPLHKHSLVTTLTISNQMTIVEFDKLRDIPVLVLVVDFSDHSHLTRADTTLETIPVTNSAFSYKNIRSEIKVNDKPKAED